MARIIVLDEFTANRIAAGEIVERPASVVKELVENSFDAGATRLGVKIKGGGLDEIEVTDNGCGMDEADSLTAFQRHATSKIKSIEDIEEICFLGFRGEALPSIAAVSNTLTTTRMSTAHSGTRLEIKGGRLLSVSSVGCPPGTTICVKDLFFNTPARLKHMKTKSTESGLIIDILSRLSLARPDISIRLENEGRTVFMSGGTGNLQDTAAAVYSVETARKMIALEVSESTITVRGMIAPPAINRSTKRNITIVINGRYVRNNLMIMAVIEGYGTLLPTGRFPLAAISVNIEPRLLDVNIHPSKMIVKVSGEDKIFNIIKRAVMKALRTDKIIPGFTKTFSSISYQNNLADITAANVGNLNLAEKKSTYLGEVESSYQVAFTGKHDPVNTGSLLNSIYPLEFLPPTYILAGSSNGLFLIDHHAAHERILYEKFLDLLSKDKVEVQLLLVPIMIELTPREYKAVEENLSLLTSLGITGDVLMPDSLIVRGVPAGMKHFSAEALIRDLLEFMIDPVRPIQKGDLIKKIATTTACSEAIKSGFKLNPEEAQTIVRDLKETDIPYTCPHGRPTMINITEQELKTRFKRN